MAEKYSDAQKELQRQILTVQSYQGEIAQLTRELQEVNKRNTDKDAALKDLRTEIESMKELHARQMDNVLKEIDAQQGNALQKAEEERKQAERRHEKISEELTNSQLTCARLQEEIASLKTALQKQDNAQTVLDDYKKRAQVALKQASATSATLSAKIEDLETTVAELTKSLAEANEEAEICRASMNEAEKCCEDVRYILL